MPILRWPRGLMDKASDFGSEDCEFESRRGRLLFNVFSSAILFQENVLPFQISKKKVRCRQDSNLRGKIPMDF